MSEKTFPEFAFFRHPNVEEETGVSVAGILVIERRPSEEFLDALSEHLEEMFAETDLETVVCWAAGTERDFTDEELLAWCEDRLHILIISADDEASHERAKRHFQKRPRQ